MSANTHPAILKVQEFHDDLPRDSDLSQAQQVLATAVDRITWGKVRDHQTANFVYGDLPRGYRAALIRADKRCEEALDMALEQYFLSLEDQDEVLAIEMAVAEAMAEHSLADVVG